MTIGTERSLRIMTTPNARPLPWGRYIQIFLTASAVGMGLWAVLSVGVG